VTVSYALTLAIDISRQDWAAALDASREAVLVIVGWAAVIIVLAADRDSAAMKEQPGDGSSGSGDAGGSSDASHAPAEPTPDNDSVVAAQWRVHRLRTRLAELAAARDRAGSGADPDLDREVASTTARLEHARQWLTSAQSALTVSRPEKRQAARPAADNAGELAAVAAQQAADHQRQ